MREMCLESKNESIQFFYDVSFVFPFQVFDGFVQAVVAVCFALVCVYLVLVLC